MKYAVIFTRTAERESHEVYRWLRDHTEQHSAEWYYGFYDAVQSLEIDPERCPLAPESAVVSVDVRRMLYGNRRHAYRVLYLIRGSSVYILHVRHAARASMRRDEIELPPEE
ncbi:MAG: type II toxin-antitoxin system RelE/ParE family toxin [Burkholderiales bacterium]|nr:type II toxin-antitoxin system RelE/ParE family toxin [Phycisphaerae bacterium]